VPPAPSSLALIFQAQDLTLGAYAWYSPTPPTVIFESGHPQNPVVLGENFPSVPVPLPDDRIATVVLSPDLLGEQGFGTLLVENGDGRIVVAPGTRLKTPIGGSINLSAANIDIFGEVIAPAGRLSFSAYNFSPNPLGTLILTPAVTPDRGVVTLGPSAVLSTAGVIVDDRRFAPAPHTLPLVVQSTELSVDGTSRNVTSTVLTVNSTQGGSISIGSYSANLATGSVIDVSGGLAVNAFGKVSYGNGGSISIKTGQDLKVLSILGGNLQLGSTLMGFSGAKGGALSIQAPLVQIGGSATSQVALLPGGDTAPVDTLLLVPEFFSTGGFTSFTINGLGAVNPDGGFIPAVTIAPEIKIYAQAESFIADLGAHGESASLRPMLLPDGMRSPVSLSFGASALRDGFTGDLRLRGDIVMGAKSEIRPTPWEV